MDFSNISPTEFEQICSDILSNLLKKDTRYFKEGKDGGIDAEYRDSECFVIAQCKRYNKTPYSKLLSDLKKEREKINIQNPNSYYLFISQELSPNQVNEIFTLFQPYVKCSSDIYDLIKINDYLKTEEASWIIKKHINLWIDSFSTLREMFKADLSKDIDTLMLNIESHKNIYYKTASYYEALNLIYKKRMLLVSGKPGVGKTTLCELILLDLLSKLDKPTVVYSQVTDYRDIIENLSNDDNGFQIIYVDDFLGQSCVELSSSSSMKSIQMLLSYVETHKNTFLIINSRIQVLNEVKNINENMYYKLKKLGFLDLSSKQLSFADKAHILYNHIYYSSIGENRIKQLVDNSYYLNIIRHRNFAPRIIEYLFCEYRYPENEMDYLKFVKDTLEHPEAIWENEYNKKIFPEDRMLVETLYSITNYRVEYDILKKAFNEQKSNSFYRCIDWTQNDLFRNSITRLNGGLLSLQVSDGNRMIQVSDPSVNDFLKTVFENKSKEMIKEIANNSISFDQFNRLYDEKTYFSIIVPELHKKGFTQKAIIINSYLYYKTILYIASLCLDNSSSFIELMFSAIKYFNDFRNFSLEFGIGNLIDDIVVLFVNDKTLEFYPSLVQENNFNLLLKLVQLRCFGNHGFVILKQCNILNANQKQRLIDVAIDKIVSDAFF